ncbi:MAG: hypothetical protein BRD46_01280 [Bacteroidetes bacterium QS_8_68_15]|nr:MAG: hypothetical protein BRD46_01280 [Bacteroidetes bacterium QS_8_68_15]
MTQQSHVLRRTRRRERSTRPVRRATRNPATRVLQNAHKALFERTALFCIFPKRSHSFPARPPTAVRRALYPLLAVLAVLIVAGGALWYFTYGVSTAPPAEDRVPGLARPVEIAWNDAGVATIRADSVRDRYAALGYVHGAERPWLVTLWRQTATGRLGEWFGERPLRLDRLTRRLGFAELARRAYTDLPGEQKALLRAYADGMNAALGSEAVRNRGEFALLEQTPDAWEPWHALAIERLYAYLASSPPRPDSLGPGAPPAARRFLRADSSLRRWLHLHDFDQSAAWAARGPEATHLFYRHVYGASAIPVLQAVLLRRPGDQGHVAALSLPGTPFLPAGRAGRRAWALLPSGPPLDVVRAPYDTSADKPLHERILGADGSEHLVTMRRTDDALLLGDGAPARSGSAQSDPPATRLRSDTTRTAGAGAAARPDTARPDTARADSLWQVRWGGFRPVTDLAAWRALAGGEPPGGGESGGSAGFQLLRAGGLTADSSGSFSLFGTPARAVRFDEGLVASGTPAWTPSLAEQVQTRLTQFDAEADTAAAAPIRPQQWVRADSSAWAARVAPDLLASVDSLSRTRSGTFTYEERTDLFGRAIRYLRNWNFSYDGASIGASIFDTWVAAYRRDTGRLPGVRSRTDSLATSDSLRAREDRRRFRLLGDAVSRLARLHGQDIEQWRWERVAPDTRRFPGWSDSLSGRRLRTLAETRYAPIDIPGGGHLSTLRQGASPISLGLPAPAAYEAWLSTDRWRTLYVRRRRFDTSTPFGRYRAQRSAPDPLPLRFEGARAPSSTTRLVPAGTTATPEAVRARF